MTASSGSSWWYRIMTGTGVFCSSLAIILLSLSWVSLTTSKSSSTSGHRKLVTVNLESNWKETPLLLETSEFLAEEDPSFFWTFIDSLHEKYGETLPAQLTPADEHSISVDFASHVLGSEASENRIPLLKFALSLRMYSPTVEMFNQMAVSRLKIEDSSSHDQRSHHVFVEVSSRTPKTQLLYSPEDVEGWLSSLSSSDSPFTAHPETFKVDHVFPGVNEDDQKHPTAVLYGQIGNPNFHKIHSILKAASKEGKVKYLLRHFLVSDTNSTENFVNLSGYGVELAMKSTEYRAVDDTRVKGEESTLTQKLKELEKEDTHGVFAGFQINKLKELHPNLTTKLDDFSQYLTESTKEVATLKVWELQELSLQLATKLITSTPVEEQLATFTDIIENFPVHAKSLIHTPVDKEVRKEVEKNQHQFLQLMNLGPQDTSLFINSLFFDVDTLDVFSLFTHIRSEVKVLEGLHKVLTGKQAEKSLEKLLKLDISSSSSSSKTEHFQIDFRDSAVHWINDIESDKPYRNWPSSIQDLLRPTYPGMLRNVKKNLYNLVLVVDPSRKDSFDLIKLAESFFVHKAPLRIGFVFLTPSPNDSSDGSTVSDGTTNASVALLNAFNFISQEKGGYEGLSFITDIIAAVEDRDIQVKDVHRIFKGRYPSQDVHDIFGPDSEYNTGRKLTVEFLSRTGLGTTSPRALLNGVLLRESDLTADTFEEAVLTEIMRQTPTIQKAVYNKELTDDHDITDWLMTQKNVLPRLNTHILKADRHRFVDLSSQVQTKEGDSVSHHPQESLSALRDRLTYLTSKRSKCPAVTIWIASDVSTPEGRSVLRQGLLHIQEDSESTRIAVLHTKDNLYTRLIETIIQVSKDTDELIRDLLVILEEPLATKLISAKSDEDFNSIIPPSFSNREILIRDMPQQAGFVKLSQSVYESSLSHSSSSGVLVVNGRAIPIPSGSPFTREDFNLIQKYNLVSYGDKIKEILKEEGGKGRTCSDLIMKISSVLLSHPSTKVRHDIKFFNDRKSALHFSPKETSKPFLDVIVIVEPLSRGAQKVLPLLSVLQRVVNCKIRLFLNCIDKHSDMPLKNFYRAVLGPELSFDSDGSILRRSAVFSSLPQKPLFTLAMSTPENWLVESVRSPYDLDNIHLEQVEGKGVWADFKLEYILLEGHCFEQSTGNPPRGLQFVLSSGTDIVGDTIVMANLGYFQLKAKPGLWSLSLRSGRSASIYQISSFEGPDSSSSLSNPSGGPLDHITVTMGTFRSHVIKVKVNKRPGQAHRDLLSEGEDDDESNSLWESLTGSWTAHSKSKEVAETEHEPDDRVHIFSLASGHLYERLLRIMMVSVLKNTNSKIKFWFLKNYLSPSFKEFLPYMAEEYNFEYELVEYKWPRWLHQQTEKQRIIWGYKILFLDVLFPLNVKRVIYIDADQVVRADVKELNDMDLDGAPYAYTPFCDSRDDMDGFRFWKSGYWASHLQGRKYHISALYVVDLQRFRRVAAGDRLRGQYQGLSQDPNSLSNLDQDLPNNMIHQVAIKSLPQEWLWCETWCDDESKLKAKTIDLCNNPKTKEPKLTAARRILPEWEGYDTEVKTLMERLKKSGSKTSDKISKTTSHHHQHEEL